METKFKKGDRVRYKYDDGTWIEFQLNSWHEGVVVEKGNSDEEVFVRFSVCEELGIDEIELIKPTDKKHAFLKEFKDLLEKYDAEIQNVYEPSKEQYTKTIIHVGEDTITYNFTDGFDKNNIMDYEHNNTGTEREEAGS